MPTPQEHAQELVENFEFLDDWDNRIEYLFDLARKLPPMDEADKTEAHKVKGCQSNVWIVAQARPDGIVDFVADSDALITKGLIAMLHKVYSGQTAEAILSFDIEPVFEQMGLGQYLSMNRRNGLYGMVQKIKGLAKEAVK